MSNDKELDRLKKRVDALEHELGIQRDIHDIRRLQYAYGYFIDKCMYDETVDLFADDGEVWFMNGIFKGRAGVKRLYIDRFRANFTGNRNGPVPGFLLDHPQLQAIIDVAPDGKTAKVRARSTMQAGRHKDFSDPDRFGWKARQWWEGGIYENRYVKENGVWKIKVLNYRPFWHADFETGWANSPARYVPPFEKTFPEDPLGPDELMTESRELWPNTDVVPFHYVHPVTGKAIEVPESIPLDSGWTPDDV